MNFDRLILLREKEELFQKDIGKILGVSQKTYSAWEIGNKIIPLKHLNSLCIYYKLSMDYVVGISENKETIKFNKPLDRKTIGQNIVKIREKYKLSQRDLAKVLNTTCSTICAYEKGKTLILTAFAYQICTKYNISMDWLCGRKK